MTDGLQFIGENKTTIFDYAYDPLEDEEGREEYPIQLGQMFHFSYEDYNISESYSGYLSDIYNNSYGILPCETLKLAPDTKELFAKDTFPDEFFGYMDQLNEFIRTKLL